MTCRGSLGIYIAQVEVGQKSGQQNLKRYVALKHFKSSIRALQPAGPLAASSPEAAATTRVRAPILVVDDHDDTRALLEIVLQMEGYRVCLAAHGLQALECVEREPPCLILLDVTMPVMDGPTFARQLRAMLNPRVAQTPIILVSAISYAARVMLAVGAVELIPKPITIDHLLDACARHCPPSAKLH